MNRLVVGLGNPGKNYGLTRHNVGFLLLDLLAEESQASAWDSSAKFQGHLAKGRLHGQEALYLKPQTFMNLSGRSVCLVSRYFQIPPSRCLVLSDDLDLPFGAVRLRLKGGPGGHNGLRSLVEGWGSQDFPRIKIGIGRPPLLPDGRPCMDPASWVLAPFSPEELASLKEKALPEVMAKIGECWSTRDLPELPLPRS